MAKSVLEIIIGLTDNTQRGLANIGKNLKDVGKNFQGVGKDLTAGLTLPIVGAGAAILKLSTDAASLQGVSDAFDGIASSFEGGSKAMLAALQESSGGLITNRDLMAKFNLAAGLVSKDFAERLPDAFGALGKVAAATGEDMGFLLDSLVRGVGRLSPMILDNLGIQVDLTSANEAYAEQLGISASELTKTQQQTALMNQVMEKLRTNTADMPEVIGSAASEFGSLKTMLTNVKDEIGTELLPAVIPLIKTLAELAKDVLPGVINAVRTVVDWFTNLSQPMQMAILAALAFAAAIGPILVIIGTLISTVGTLVTVLGPLVGAFGAVAGGVAAVVGVISGPLLAIIAVLIAVVAGLYLAWQNNWLGMRDIFNFFVEQFSGIFEAFKLAFEGDWEGFGQKLREVWDNAWETIKQVASNAWESIKNIDWASLGRSIIEGIANGVGAAAGLLVNAARVAAAAAWAAIKAFFQSDSPSKLMIDFGEKDVMGAWATGITKGAVQPAKAMLTAAKSAFANLGSVDAFSALNQQIPKIAANLDFGALGGGMGTGGLALAGQTIVGGDTTINNHFYDEGSAALGLALTRKGARDRLNASMGR